MSEQSLSLLGVKAELVSARILTSTKSTNAAFLGHARAFKAQYAAGPPLEVRTSAAFHDRFIAIDDEDQDHFGASLKDAAKKNAFMFSRLEETAVVSALKDAIARQWAIAAVVPL